MDTITFRVSPPVTNAELNTLLDAAWGGSAQIDFATIHSRSLAYLCAYNDEQLIGYVNIAWDGGIHAFLLDTTVHPDVQRRGVGTRLVREAVEETRARGIAWLHVDYEPHLDGFYRSCGFMSTHAGLIRLRESAQAP